MCTAATSHVLNYLQRSLVHNRRVWVGISYRSEQPLQVTTARRVLLVAVAAADEYGIFISDSRGLIKHIEGAIVL